MKTLYIGSWIFALVTLFTPASLAQPSSETSQALSGQTGSDVQYNVGWLDLEKQIDLRKGDRLRLTIGGDAKKCIIRLLAKGTAPTSSAGIINGAFNVPENRVLEVTLPIDRSDIIQISAHGGPNPWGKYPLAPANGLATIEEAVLIRSK